MILMLNNKDSFVFNLARYFVNLGREMKVVDSDRISVAEIEALSPEALVISPGPCTPVEAGVSLETIAALGERLPILGVCLGHQAIAAAHGWPVVPAKTPAHGRAAQVTHSGRGLFAGLPQGFEVGLYHSLIAQEEDRERGLRVEARSPSGEVMALSHETKPLYGIQFHPESILTEHGATLLQNFLEIADAWRAA